MDFIWENGHVTKAVADIVRKNRQIEAEFLAKREAGKVEDAPAPKKIPTRQVVKYIGGKATLTEEIDFAKIAAETIAQKKTAGEKAGQMTRSHSHGS